MENELVFHWYYDNDYDSFVSEIGDAVLRISEVEPNSFNWSINCGRVNRADGAYECYIEECMECVEKIFLTIREPHKNLKTRREIHGGKIDPSCTLSLQITGKTFDDLCHHLVDFLEYRFEDTESKSESVAEQPYEDGYFYSYTIESEQNDSNNRRG